MISSKARVEVIKIISARKAIGRRGQYGAPHFAVTCAEPGVGENARLSIICRALPAARKCWRQSVYRGHNSGNQEASRINIARERRVYLRDHESIESRR